MATGQSVQEPEQLMLRGNNTQVIGATVYDNVEKARVIALQLSTELAIQVNWGLKNAEEAAHCRRQIMSDMWVPQAI